MTFFNIMNISGNYVWSIWMCPGFPIYNSQLHWELYLKCQQNVINGIFLYAIMIPAKKLVIFSLSTSKVQTVFLQVLRVPHCYCGHHWMFTPLFPFSVDTCAFLLAICFYGYRVIYSFCLQLPNKIYELSDVCWFRKVKLHDIFEDLDGVSGASMESDFVDISQMNISDITGSRSFALTAHQCFQRINRNLRSFLRRSRFPNGELRHLEEELVAFFVEWPTSVYVAELPDSYRRMMLHAVSQYLDLDARSFDVPGSPTGRQTQVENNRLGNTFVPPPTLLAKYISDNKLMLV